VDRLIGEKVLQIKNVVLAHLLLYSTDVLLLFIRVVDFS
jgi:hypothetical protein